MNLSLRFKLMVLLIATTTLMLLAYGGLALSDFSNDKIAYVYDTLLSHSVSTSRQVRSELDFISNRTKFYLRGFDFKREKLHQYTKTNFTSESRINGIWVFPVMGRSDVLLDSVESSSLSSQDRDRVLKIAKELVPEVKGRDISLRLLEEGGSKWLLALNIEDKATGRRVAVIGLISQSYFADGIVSSEMQDTFLINDSGKVLVGPHSPNFIGKGVDIQGPILRARKATGGKSGITELTRKEKDSWLVSFSNVGVGGLSVVALVSKRVATGAIQVLLVKSGFFFLIILCLTIIVSVLSSRQLTSSLKALLESTRRIAKGDFLVESEVKSRDEVGELAEGFNRMTVEIRRLMEETAEKARMENELLTAQTVQATLFPELVFGTGKVNIQGYYQPASECGGDWFYYIQKGKKTYMLIGDATGHGVPAALVTAAAKSASRVIEEFEEIPLPRIAAILNRAIFETSKAKVMMTFFIGCFHEDNGQFTYVNASHDPPFLIPHKEEELKKKDIVPLLGTTCRRLGEKMDSEYIEESIVIKTGDRIVFYTDGVTELMGVDEEMWGEREFIKILLSSFNTSEGIKEPMVDLTTAIEEYRGETPLDDDVTYFMFQNRSSDVTV